MQHLEVSCAVRPIWWPLGVKWLNCTGYVTGHAWQPVTFNV